VLRGKVSEEGRTDDSTSVLVEEQLIAGVPHFDLLDVPAFDRDVRLGRVATSARIAYVHIMLG
jgi:hypothetical protein